ncbi:hydroxylamine reductase [Andreesenia angusta]|uniref:Hydroxylamine reductase n=1 Tax=Andreesenia angusta TaxID=39480 RepID=A0A1S1V6C5_9FIRM|nr:hydroxylamine reductase [Andreesenia angusta]OHW61667.1 hydroxylamine reductase [Andreesenia angusta]
MSMFCYQCQEAANGTGCTQRGVCGKTSAVANIQDLLVHTLKGIALYNQRARELKLDTSAGDAFIMEGLFMTITNANFDYDAIVRTITEGLELRDKIKSEVMKTQEPKKRSLLDRLFGRGEGGSAVEPITADAATWRTPESKYDEKAKSVGVLATADEDVRSLRELITYGLKGMAAYAEHAYNLGSTKDDIFAFIEKALVATLDDTLSIDDLVALTLETGKFGVDVMALLDAANTSAYGNPEITEVNIGVRSNPAILISGHDLKDMERLLEQTDGTGVDVYTHSEMLPANYYPAFKKYDHFVGNYGNAWWKQQTEFASFNGPILFTTNCIVPPKSDEIRKRIYTTGASGFPGCTHIEMDSSGNKDFSAIIEHAKKCASPTEIETGKIVGGFAHAQVMQLADKVVDAVKSGAIRKFFVMAGCDGRMKSRDYYTEFAEKLPKDTVILTAGCAKYRYNKLGLGDIGGIPRVLDAGQCNDSYSLAVIALKLKEVFELNDINELPIAYNIAWYEQKAVIVLLALLSLGVKNIHLGPTLPAFLSPNVAKVLVENFGIGGITSVDEDMKMFLGV